MAVTTFTVSMFGCFEAMSRTADTFTEGFETISWSADTFTEELVATSKNQTRPEFGNCHHATESTATAQSVGFEALGLPKSRKRSQR